jgi:tyrosine-protein kinase Etk/Wzc
MMARDTTVDAEQRALAEAPMAADRDDEINLLDLVVVLAKHRLLLISLPLLVAGAAVAYSLWLPDIYTATARLLPPQQPQSAASALLAQLGGVTGLPTARNQNDVYVAMLKSRTVADNLIQRFDLMKAYHIDSYAQARDRLDGSVRITAGKDALITIEFDDTDAKRAADFANAYVAELMKLTQVLAVTEASQRRLFFERQFVQAKDNLAQAEAAARIGLARGGLVKVDEQGKAMVEVTARLRGEITAREVQLSAMRTYAAEDNPAMRRTRQELEALKMELAKIEGDDGPKPVPKGAPGKGMDSLRLLRDVKYNETLYELLAKQYELAKIDEARDASVVQVLDAAIAPERKSKPHRTLIVLQSALIASVVAVILAFVLEALERARRNPKHATRVQDIKRYLRRGR